MFFKDMEMIPQFFSTNASEEDGLATTPTEIKLPAIADGETDQSVKVRKEEL